MANRRYIDFPIASTSGDTDIILIWQSGANKQTTKATFLSGLPENLDELNDVAISGLTNGQILRYDSVTGKWENTDQGNLDLTDLNDVQIVSPSNGQVLVYNSSTSKWENSSGGFVPYTGAVTTVNLGSQTIQAGQFVKVGGTAAQFLKANGSIDSTAYGTGSVTSVALTMPTAFSVANSPITTAGTLAVTGAGLVSQYIRGDGSLADFPATTGGGSSVSYYLNGSVSQGTIGGVAYKQLNRTPVFGAGTDFTIAADGYIASFITDASDPNKLLIPAGNWNFETYFSASSNGGSPSFYVELYKYDGTTFTLIATSSSAPELIAFGTSLNPYYSTLAVPQTTLALTDRLAIRYYVTHSGRTITLHTEDNHLCQIITTFTTGLTALNGLTAQVQNFAVGTSGTDFAIASATATHTFNLPTASATNRGALSSADWTTFNNKTSNLGTVTSVGLSSATSGVTIGSTPVTTSGTITLAIATASGSLNGLLSSTDWTTFNGKQNALTNPVTGTGVSGQVAYFTGTTAIGSESNLFWDGSNDRLGIGANNPVKTLDVRGTLAISNSASSFWYMDRDDSDGRFKIVDDANNDRFNISTGGNVLINSTSDNGARLQVSGTATFSGNVVLGTTALTGGGAAQWLTANGTAYGGGLISSVSGVIKAYYYYDNSANAAMVQAAAGVGVQLWANNTVALSIASTGAATFSSTLRSQGDFYGANGTSTAASIRFYDANTGLYHPGSDALGIITSGTERMRISSGGDIGIGADSNSLVRLLTRGKDSGTTNYAFIAQNSSTTNLFLIRNDGAASFFSLGTGTVTATAGTLSTVSDSSYKIDDGFIDSAIEKVLNLKPRYFYWNEKSGLPKHIRQLGFYAQEVNKALGEEAANTPQDKNTPWGISDRSMIAYLTKAIQELKQEIDTLKN